MQLATVTESGQRTARAQRGECITPEYTLPTATRDKTDTKKNDDRQGEANLALAQIDQALGRRTACLLCSFTKDRLINRLIIAQPETQSEMNTRENAPVNFEALPTLRNEAGSKPRRRVAKPNDTH